MGLALAGLAGGYALILPSSGHPPGLASRLFMYAFFGGLAVIAIVVGSHIAIAPGGRVPRLPRWLLFVGAGLLFLCGVVQIILVFLVPRAANLWMGLALGLGGGLGALRLALRRGRPGSTTPDGA